MADKADLSIYQGDDYAAQVTVYEGDGTTPFDLAGYSSQAQIRPNLTDPSPDPVASFTVNITQQESNVITIGLPHDVSKTLTNLEYVWDLQVIDPTGLITTLLAGQVRVTREVTRIYS